jgi:hypothetical protein
VGRGGSVRGWIGVQLARRAGYSTRQALIIMSTATLTVLAGAKLLYLAEHVLFPQDDALARKGASKGRTAELVTSIRRSCRSSGR